MENITNLTNKDYSSYVTQAQTSNLTNQIKKSTSSEMYRRQSSDVQATLIELNIADDYFKAKKQGDSLESDIDLKDTASC
mgnify:CR=1 FL=1